jgi:cell division septation protein DedD
MEYRHGEYRDDDTPGHAQRSTSTARWVRGAVALAVVVTAVVIALPYLLNWLAPVPPPLSNPVRVQSTPAPTVSALAPSRLSDPAPAALPAPKPVIERVAIAPGEVQPAPLAETRRAGASRSAIAPARSSPDRPARSSYWIQVGLFKESKNADDLARKLRDEGLAVQVASVSRTAGGGLSGGTYHAVRAGAFRDLPRANAAKRQLASRGHSGFITEVAAR